MDKYEDWAERLSNFLGGCQTREFVRGEFDCALFACDAFEIQTGKDPGEDFRGKYNTKKGAIIELKKNGGTLRNVAVKKFKEFKLEIVDKVFAQRGDIAYARIKNDSVLAVVDLSGNFLTLSPHVRGTISIDIKYVKIVWRID